ncbi:hypothetical protein PN36_29635 [Candidatus Thiomargarita nelsonii]|uniref:TonB-dependent receptor n=1 Tax=Candidatus Thiomargarita nelsonii TaxID=1003181 RepID=A0A0A6PBA9_9GAMM|nr:hypothetical protein PN36_29635 [Candidatus Thiomargarita nelsonii]
MYRIFALVIFLSVTMPVNAETELPEITVTAKGYESETLETPHAITVLKTEEIQRSGKTTVGDLLRGQPGIAVNSDGAWGMNPVIRGMKKEQIVILVDGIRMNSAQPQGAIASYVDLSQIARVEVVKGPASVLYGSGAMGGVINFITKGADFSDKPSMSGTLSAFSSTANEGFKAATSVALSNPNHALSLNVSGLDYNDYEASDGTVEHSGYKQSAFSGQYKYRLSSQQTIKIMAQHQNTDDVWYPGSVKFQNKKLGQVIVHSPEQDRDLFNLAYEQDFKGDSSLKLRTELYYHNVHRTIRAFSKNLQRDYVTNDVDFETVGGAVKLEMFPNDEHYVLAGIDAWRMQGNPNRYMFQPPTFNTKLLSNPFENGELVSTGLFLQDEILLEQWTIKLGARYDRVTGNADKMGNGANMQTTGLESTDNTFSWSTGAIYNYSAALNPYLSLAQGYRAADMRERFETSPRGDGYIHLGNPHLEPERNLTLELGMKGQWERTNYTTAVYFSRIDGAIAGRITERIDPKTGFPIKQTENLSRVDLIGLELSLKHALDNHLWLFASSSYQRGENKEDDEPFFQVPPLEATIGVQYLPEQGFNLDTRFRAVSHQNRIATQFSNGTEDATAGFATVELGFGYRFGKTGVKNDLRFTITNLFDRAYHEHLTEGISGQEPQAVGRSFNLMWSMDY